MSVKFVVQYRHVYGTETKTLWADYAPGVATVELSRQLKAHADAGYKLLATPTSPKVETRMVKRTEVVVT